MRGSKKNKPEPGSQLRKKRKKPAAGILKPGIRGKVVGSARRAHRRAQGKTKLVPGVCRYCGCTETTPCMSAEGACSWHDRKRTLCTNARCLAKKMATLPVRWPTAVAKERDLVPAAAPVKAKRRRDPAEALDYAEKLLTATGELENSLREFESHIAWAHRHLTAVRNHANVVKVHALNWRDAKERRL